jgi:hypothetical protein
MLNSREPPVGSPVAIAKRHKEKKYLLKYPQNCELESKTVSLFFDAEPFI